VASAPRVLSSVYFVGLVAVLAMVSREFLRTRRLIALARPADPAWQERLRRLERDDRRGRRVQLYLSDTGTAPLAVGLIRRRIVLPTRLVDCLSERDLDLILRHELAHHGGRHLAAAWLRAAACAVWWWHPLVWIASASLRHAQEEQCDDEAVARGGVSAERYAEALVLAATPAREPAFTLGVAEQGHPLEARVRRLLGPRPSRRGLWLAWIVGAAMAIAALPGGEQEPHWRGAADRPPAELRDILYSEMTAAGAPAAVAERVADRVAARAARRR
jgi:beta-lactamase regulating signal transducer with metallopeptidase domain